MTEALVVENLRMEFPGARTTLFGRRQPFVAVDNASLSVAKGEILGVVGESGSGKSTLARCVVGYYQQTAGRIVIDGTEMGTRRSRAQLSASQLVFQDPFAALNPERTIGSMLGELLRVHRIVPNQMIHSRSVEVLASVGLHESYLEVYPGSLSGGQRQRANIARALILEPQLLVADEVVSALDVSVQASVLNLLLELRDRLGISILFISHNLAVIRQVCDRVAVMRMGAIVEHAPVTKVFASPQHEYTRELLNAIPHLRSAGEPTT